MKTNSRYHERRHSHWKWVIVFSAFSLTFLTDGVRLSAGVIFTELMETFREDNGKTAAIISVMFGVQNILGPVTSVLVNKYGCRCTVMVGAVVYFIGFIASSTTSTFHLLYLFFGVISGVGYSFMYFPTSVIILQYFDDKKTLANGIAMCGTGIGGFVFNPLINSLFETYSFRGGILVLAGIMLHGAVAGALMRPSGTNGDKPFEANPEHNQEKNRPSEESSNKIRKRSNKSNVNFVTERTDGNEANDEFKNEKSLVNLSIRNGLKAIDSDKAMGSHEELYELSEEANALCDNKLDTTKLSKDNAHFDSKFRELARTDSENESDVPMKVYKNAKDPTYKTKPLTRSETSQTIEDSENQNSIRLPKRINSSSEKVHKNQNKAFEWEILKDPKLIWMMVSQIFLAVAFMIPFTYLPDVIISLGYSRPKAVWLMSSISISSTVSRLISGYIADRRFVNRQIMYCVANLICALAVTLLFWSRSYELIMILSLVYGWASGCLVAIIVVVFSDMFGARLLSNVYGLATFAGSPGQFIGPPLSGWIVDQTGRLDLVFHVSGATFFLATVTMVISVKLKDRLREKYT